MASRRDDGDRDGQDQVQRPGAGHRQHEDDGLGAVGHRRQGVEREGRQPLDRGDAVLPAAAAPTSVGRSAGSRGRRPGRRGSVCHGRTLRAGDRRVGYAGDARFGPPPSCVGSRASRRTHPRPRRRSTPPWNSGSSSAREACRDTLAQYTHAGDRYLLEEFAGAFCEDGVLEIRGSGAAAGSRRHHGALRWCARGGAGAGGRRASSATPERRAGSCATT